jgi:hypothetical protein
MRPGSASAETYRAVIRRTLAALALMAASAAPVAGQSLTPGRDAPRGVPSPPAAGAPFVQVSIPYNMASGFVTTAPAGDGTYYVTIANATATNPSSTQYGWYEPHDFHLVVGDTVYYPVTRPNLAALDLSWSGSVPPLGALVATVTFKVPAYVKKADFEFIPKNWLDNYGGSVVFCCLPQF